MYKLWAIGGVFVLVMAFLVASSFNISFHKNSAQAAKAPVLAGQNQKASCGCGAESQCGGSCQAGACKCGSACGMNKQNQ